MRATRREEEAIRSDKKAKTESVAAVFENLNTETAGTEKETAVGLEAAL